MLVSGVAYIPYTLWASLTIPSTLGYSHAAWIDRLSLGVARLARCWEPGPQVRVGVSGFAACGDPVYLIA